MISGRRQWLGGAAVVLLLGAVIGCGPTQVRRMSETSAVGLPRPSVIYVYDFAVDPKEVQLDPGGPLQRAGKILAGEDSTQDEQVIALGHKVADRIADQLVTRITAMGLTAQRPIRGTVPPAGAGAVTGQFAEIDEGNKVRRLAIGFHQGQSKVGAQVSFYQANADGTLQPMLEFAAAAESAPLPGAAVTMGVGAGVQAAGAVAGAKSLQDTIQGDADNLAKRIAVSLQQFFAKQGWTAAPSTVDELSY